MLKLHAHRISECNISVYFYFGELSQFKEVHPIELTVSLTVAEQYKKGCKNLLQRNTIVENTEIITETSNRYFSFIRANLTRTEHKLSVSSQGASSCTVAQHLTILGQTKLEMFPRRRWLELKHLRKWSVHM